MDAAVEAGVGVKSRARLESSGRRRGGDDSGGDWQPRWMRVGLGRPGGEDSGGEGGAAGARGRGSGSAGEGLWARANVCVVWRSRASLCGRGGALGAGTSSLPCAPFTRWMERAASVGGAGEGDGTGCGQGRGQRVRLACQMR